MKQYGPGAVRACGVTVQQEHGVVEFLVTGGRDRAGRALSTALLGNLELQSSSGQHSLGEWRLLPGLATARSEHACSKVGPRLACQQRK